MQWRGHGGILGITTIEPQMTSYIIETAQTKRIIGEALKVWGQKYDKLSLKIVAKFLGEHAPDPPRVVFGT